MSLGEITLAGGCVLIIAVLALDLAGVTHRGTGFRVQAAGILVIDTAPVVNLLAGLHSRGTYSVLFAGLFVGLAIWGIGAVISIKAQRSGT